MFVFASFLVIFCIVFLQITSAKVKFWHCVRNQSENDDIPEEPEKRRVGSFYLYLIKISFLIYLIYNIIDTSVSRDQNFHKWQCRIFVTCLRLYQVTVIEHCHWWEFWSRDTDASIISIKKEKLLNSSNSRSKPVYFRLLWDIVVFRLVAYLLNMICLKLRLFY